MQTMTLAQKLVLKHFGDCTIGVGRQIINDAFEKWILWLQTDKKGSDLNLHSKYESRMENITPHLLVDLNTVSKSLWLRVLATEWCYRTHLFIVQAKFIEVVRFKNEQKDFVERQKNLIVADILTQVSNLSLNEAVDFFAELAVEWSLRCRVDYSLPEKYGYTVPVSADFNEWFTSFLLWSIAVDFQVQL